MSLFLPLEHAQIAHTAGGQARTALFARYTFTGAMAVAAGALAAGIPALLVSHFDISPRSSLRAMFLLYALIGAVVWLLYRRLPPSGQDDWPWPRWSNAIAGTAPFSAWIRASQLCAVPCTPWSSRTGFGPEPQVTTWKRSPRVSRKRSMLFLARCRAW